MFTKYPQAGMYGSLDEALIRYMQQPGTIAAEADGRISAVGASTTVPSPEPTPEPAAPAPAPAPAPQPTPEPVTTPKPQPAKPSAPQTTDKEIYIVKFGDTLTSISKKYGTTWRNLQKLNKLSNPNLIYPGQKIILPAS
ncbi:putative cell wall hydrolase LytN precursor [compost metagenome]